MPKYDFRCEKCETEFSESLPMGTVALPSCPICKNAKAVRKLIRAPMVHFKGSGFYKTDSSKTVTAKPKTQESKESNETKAAEVKPAETSPIEPKTPVKKSETSL